jgi:hypothetical protein
LRYEEVSAQLARERRRVLEEIIPKRYDMTTPSQVLPVAVEIRLPEPPR